MSQDHPENLPAVDEEALYKRLSEDTRTPELLVNVTSWAGQAHALFTSLLADPSVNLSSEDKINLRDFLSAAPAPVQTVGVQLYSMQLLAQFKAMFSL